MNTPTALCKITRVRLFDFSISVRLYRPSQIWFLSRLLNNSLWNGILYANDQLSDRIVRSFFILSVLAHTRPTKDTSSDHSSSLATISPSGMGSAHVLNVRAQAQRNIVTLLQPRGQTNNISKHLHQLFVRRSLVSTVATQRCPLYN